MAEDQTQGKLLNLKTPGLSSNLPQLQTSGQQSTGGIFLPGISGNGFSQGVQQGNIKTNIPLPGINMKSTEENTDIISPATKKQVQEGYLQAVNDNVNMESWNDKIWDEMYRAETIPLLKQGIKQTWDSTKKFLSRNIKDNYVRQLETQKRNIERGANKYGFDATKAIEENNQKIQQAEERYDKYQTEVNDAFSKWVDKNMNKVLEDRYNQTTRWKTLKEGDWNNLKYGTKKAFSTSILPMIPGLVAGVLTKNPEVLQNVVFSTTLPIEDQEAYEDALEFGATKEEATAIGHIAGLINARLESIGDMAQFGGMFKRTLKQGARKEIKSGLKILLGGLKELMKGGGTEALTEGLQEFTKNVLIRAINHDKNILEGVGESAFYGGILGLGGSSLGAGGKIANDFQENENNKKQYDLEALDYVLEGEKRKAQRIEQQKEKMRQRANEKFQAQAGENAGLSDTNDYTEGRNVGGSKASSEMATEKTVNTLDAEETISENSSHGDRMTTDSFFSTDENGDYIEYNGSKLYAGETIKDTEGQGKIGKNNKSMFSGEESFVRNPEYEEYRQNFYDFLKDLSKKIDNKTKKEVVLGKTQSGSEVKLTRQQLKHIIKSHGAFSLNDLLETINNPTYSRMKIGGNIEGDGPFFIKQDPNSGRFYYLSFKKNKNGSYNINTFYEITKSNAETLLNKKLENSNDKKYQLKYEEEGYNPGVAGKDEKNISGKEGVNLRNKLNKKTVKELAEKYGIKVEVIEGMIEILENGKKKGYAYGKYIDQLLTLSEQIKESTAPHELLHAIFDMIDPETKAYLISQVMKSEGWSASKAEEWLADSFSNFFRTGKIEGAPKSTWGKIKMFFKRVRSFINGMNRWRNELEEIFTDIIESEGIEDLQGKIDESSRLNKSKERMRKRFMEYRKNAEKIQKRNNQEKYQNTGKNEKNEYTNSGQRSSSGSAGKISTWNTPFSFNTKTIQYNGKEITHTYDPKNSFLTNYTFSVPKELQQYVDLFNRAIENGYESAIIGEFDGKYIKIYFNKNFADHFEKHGGFAPENLIMTLNRFDAFAQKVVNGKRRFVFEKQLPNGNWLIAITSIDLTEISFYESDNSKIGGGFIEKYQSAGDINSEAFKKRFGDSKVVNKDGNPLVVYHGTQNKFNTFKKMPGGRGALAIFGDGFYFAESKKRAGEFKRERAKNLWDLVFGGRIMEVYLSIQNPYEVTYSRDLVMPSMEELMKKGYDGVKADTGEEIYWIAFKPNQIKSATDNVGTYDANNDDIRYQTVDGSEREVQAKVIQDPVKGKMYHVTTEEFENFRESDEYDDNDKRDWNDSFGTYVTDAQQFFEDFTQTSPRDNGSGWKKFEIDVDIKKPVLHPYRTWKQFGMEKADEMIIDYLQLVDRFTPEVQKELVALKNMSMEGETEEEFDYDNYPFKDSYTKEEILSMPGGISSAILDAQFIGESEEIINFLFGDDASRDREYLKKKGYDAIMIYEGEKDGPIFSYALFYPNRYTKKNLGIKYQEADIDPEATSPEQLIEVNDKGLDVMVKFVSEKQKKNATDVNKELLTANGNPYMWTSTNKYKSKVITDWRNVEDSKYKEYTDKGIQVARFTNNSSMSYSYADYKSKLAPVKKFKSIDELNKFFKENPNNYERILGNGIDDGVLKSSVVYEMKENDGKFELISNSTETLTQSMKDFYDGINNDWFGGNIGEMPENKDEALKKLQEYYNEHDYEIDGERTVKLLKNGNVERTVVKEPTVYKRFDTKLDALAEGYTIAQEADLYHYQGVIQKMKNPLVVDIRSKDNTPSTWSKLGTINDIFDKEGINYNKEVDYYIRDVEEAMDGFSERMKALEQYWNDAYRDDPYGEVSQFMGNVQISANNGVAYMVDELEDLLNDPAMGEDLKIGLDTEVYGDLRDYGRTLRDVITELRNFINTDRNYYALKKLSPEGIESWVKDMGAPKEVVKMIKNKNWKDMLGNWRDIGDKGWRENIKELLTTNGMDLETNDWVRYALDSGKYDGVIFKNIIDYGGLPKEGWENAKGGDVAVTFRSNQFKTWDNEDPTDSKYIRYQEMESDQKDNEGRTLSNGQVEHNKNSKIRDKKGNLLRVYHGTNSEYTVYDSSLLGASSGDLGFFGDGWYFATHKGEARYYGRNVMEGYLNITNPFYYGNMTKIGNSDFGNNVYVTIRNLGKIDESINNREIDGYKVSEIGDMVDDYLKNVKLEKLNDAKDPYNGWDITYWKVTEYGKSEIKTAMKGLSENGMLDEQLNHYMMDKVGYLKPRDLIEEMTDDARFDKSKKSFSQILQDKGYDGIVVGDTAYETDEIVAFRSNQFKNIDNLNPTDNEDIRYQKTEYEYDENGNPKRIKFGDNSEFDPSIFGENTREEQIEEDKENEKNNPFYDAWMKYNNQNYKDDQKTFEEFLDGVMAWGERQQDEYDMKLRDLSEAQNDPKMLELQLRAVKLMEEETNVGKKFGKNVSKEVKDRQQKEVETKREELIKDIFNWMYPGLRFEDATYEDQKMADQKESDWELMGRDKIEEKLKYFKKDKNGNWESKNIKIENPEEKWNRIVKTGNFDEIFSPVDRVIEWKTPQGQKGRLDKTKDPKQFKKVMEKINSGKTKTKVELKDVTQEVRALEKYRAQEEAEKERKKKERNEAMAKKKQDEYKKLVRMKAFQRLVDMQRFEKYPFLTEEEIKNRYGFTDEEWKKITEQEEIKLPKKWGEKAISDLNKAVFDQVKVIRDGLERQNRMKQKDAEKNLGEIGEIDVDILLGRDEEKGQKEVEEFEKLAKEEKKKSKKEKNKRLEQAREDVTQVEIDKERENSKSEKERVDKIIKSTKTDKTVRGSAKETATNVITPVSTRIRKISPKIYRELMRYFQNKDILTNERLKEIDPFLKAMGKIRKENPVRFMDIWVALANRNIGYANGLLQEYGVKVPTKLLDTIYDEAEDVGLNINYLGSYYPLSVKAPKSFLEELMKVNKGDIASEIEKRIQEESKKKGGPLDESEVSAIINDVIAGEEKGPDVNVGNKHLKKRNTEIQRTPQMLEYCDDPISTIIGYIEGMTQSIERAKFLGKSRSGNIHDLGDYVYNAKNGLMPDQQDELMELLKSVFNDESPNKFFQAWRDIATLTTLGSPSSTLTQLSDLGFSIYENGWRETLKAVWDIFASRKGFDLQDMGVVNRGEEYTNINSQKNLLQKAIHNVFTYGNFFSQFDTFGKSTFIQSTWRKRQKRALKGENGDPQLRKDIQKWTDDEYMTDKIINDLKKGVFSEDVALVMYMKLGNIQPLTKAQMPKAYLDYPNRRIFYQFKTFGIKQLDYVLQETKENMKGWKNLSTTEKYLRVAQVASMIFIMTLMGVGASELKDISMRRRSNSLLLRWIFGENVGTEQIWDKISDSALQLFGLSRYTVMQAKSDPVDAILSLFTTVPATNIIEYPFRDILKAFKDDGSINWRNPSSYQLIPVIGKYRYWIYGGGQDKQQEELDKENKTTTSVGSSRSTRNTRSRSRNTRNSR